MSVLTAPNTFQPMASGGIVLPTWEQALAVAKARHSQRLDYAFIVDTLNDPTQGGRHRAEEIASHLRPRVTKGVEITGFDPAVAGQAQDFGARLEDLLAGGKTNVLIVTNYFALGLLKDVEDAVHATGNGVRAWVATCCPQANVIKRKKAMSVRLGTRHIPYNSSDPRVMHEAISEALQV